MFMLIELSDFIMVTTVHTVGLDLIFCKGMGWGVMPGSPSVVVSENY